MRFLKLFLPILLLLSVSLGQDVSAKQYWIGGEPNSSVTATEAQAIEELATAIDEISAAEAAKIMTIAEEGDATIEDLTLTGDATIGDDVNMLTANPQVLITDSDIDLVADGDTATTKLLPGSINLYSSIGTVAKIEFFADTLCAIVATDTVRLIPAR